MILLHRLQAHHFKQLADVSLIFPREGAILIEGSNEAGKSSLFEAVFFALYGQTLINDRDYRIEELRTYGAEEMRVELEFSIEDRPFSISRRVGQKTTAKLLCAPGEDGARESISILTEIRRRLEEELRLSPAALLNTCFVEQKKLDRLELLGAEARKGTINELLNLRVLTALDSEFKITREDEAALRSLQSRVEIAHLDAALPALQEEERTARCGWLYAQLQDLQAEWSAIQEQMDAAAARQKEIASRRSEITGALQTAIALRERLGALRSNLLLRARRWEEAAATYNQSRREVEGPQRRAATLPERRQQWEVWTSLLERLQTVERLHRTQEQEDALRGRLEIILSTQERQERLEAQITPLTLRLEECERDEKSAAATIERASQRAALSAWAEAVEQRTESLPGEGIQSLVPRRETAQALLAAAERQIETAARQKRIGLALAAAGILTGAVMLITHLWPLIILALLLLAGGGFAGIRAAKSGAEALREKDEASNELAGLEGERRALQRRAELGTAATDRLRLREEEALSTLERLGVEIPSSPSEARTRAATLPAMAVEDARHVYQQAQNALQQVSTELQLVHRRIHEERGTPAPDRANLETEIEALRRSRQELSESLNDDSHEERQTLWNRERVVAELDQDHLPTTSGELQASLASLRTLLNHDEEEAQELPGLLRELESRAAGLHEQAAEFSSEWKTTLPGAVVPSGPSEALQRLPQLEQETAEALAALHEPHCREENDRLETESRKLQAQIAAWQRQSGELQDRQQALLPALESAGVEGWRGGGVEGWMEEPTPGDALTPQPPLPRTGEGEKSSPPTPNDAQRRVFDTGGEQQPLPNTERQSSPPTSNAGGEQQPLPNANFLTPNTRFHSSSPRVGGQGAGTPTAAAWEVILREREETIRKNRSDRRAAAALWDVTEELLSLPETQAAYAAEEERLEVRRRAGIAVAKTRQSIVSRVMPLTLQNMRQLLPLLTEGRYADAEWDEAANMLSVYDSRAGCFQRKRVFSGGARDQISLALRLAFALATLPGEHNVRPGWLFLDEPLSSFDRQRTAALVNLITHGLIRREFAQIFLVSHSESFDAARFDYRLRIEGGAVVESTLPSSVP